MQLFNLTFSDNKKHFLMSSFLLIVLFINILSADTTYASSVSLYPEINKKSVGLESYAMNIFCTEVIEKKYIKVVSGSSVFLSNPTEDKSVILTNAHVARHLLDKNKKCVGRTGSPAVTTHKLTLRYIPSFWLQSNGAYVIGDPNKDSTGEFDFAIIEAQRIKPLPKKTATLYDVLKSTLHFQLKDYDNPTITSYFEGSILSYPAQKTLSKNVYNPLYLKKDPIHIEEVYSSPTTNEPDSLLDTQGSVNIDHGSSGGMVVLQSTTNNLIGLSSVLIHDNAPQIVRVVTLKHIFSIIEKDLGLIQTNQSDIFAQILKQAREQKISDDSFIVFQNSKLTSLLEQQTRKTLLNLGIVTR